MSPNTPRIGAPSDADPPVESAWTDPATWLAVPFDTRFTRALVATAATVTTLAAAAYALQIHGSLGVYEEWLTYLGFVALLTAASACVTGALVNPTSLTGVRLLGAIGLGMLVPYALAGRPIAETVVYSPVSLLLTIGIAAVRPGFGLGISLLGSLGLGAATWWVRAPSVGEVQAILEGGIFASTGVAIALGLDTLHDRLQLLHRVAVRADASAAEAREAAERVRAQERFAEIVHHYVIAALLQGRLAAGAAGRAHARALAEQAIAALDPQPGPAPREWAGQVGARAEARGLTLTLEQRGTPRDREISAALLDSVTEALNNVRKHAGTTDVAVLASFSPRRSRVVIADRGRGFDPAAVPPGRLGLGSGIAARILAHGGSLEIDSAPGQGTRLTLTVPRRPRPGQRAAALDPAPASKAPLVAVLVAAQIFYLAIGLTYLHTMYVPLVSLLAVGLAQWSLARLVVAAPDLRPTWLPVLLVFGAPVVCAVNTMDLAIPDWRLWFVGMMDVGVVAIGLLVRRRIAVVAALVTVALLVLVPLVRDGLWVPGVMINAGMQLVLWAIVARFLRWGYYGSSERIAADATRARYGEEQRASAAVRSEYLAARIAELGTRVHELLGRIAGDAALGPQERVLCGQLERSLRERLDNPLFVDDATAAALERARLGGAEVEVATRSLTQVATAETLRTAMASLLPRLPAGSFIRVTAMDGATPMIVVERASEQRLLVLGRAVVAATPGAAVDIDEGTLIIELRVRGEGDPAGPIGGHRPRGQQADGGRVDWGIEPAADQGARQPARQEGKQPHVAIRHPRHGRVGQHQVGQVAAQGGTRRDDLVQGCRQRPR